MPEALSEDLVLEDQEKQAKDLKVAREAPEDRDPKATDRGRAAKDNKEIPKSQITKKLLKIGAATSGCPGALLLPWIGRPPHRVAPSPT